MLTLAQLTELTDRYGADPGGWPPALRTGADALLARSPEARALLRQAATLDSLLAQASAKADGLAWAEDRDQEAALMRLRARVAARLSPSRAHPPLRPVAWVALAAAASIAVLAGVLIGSRYTASADPAADSLLTALQPVPIHLTAE